METIPRFPRLPWQMGWFMSARGDNDVYALNASTGAKLWSFYTGNEVGDSPALANGVVYVATYNWIVYALNARTGTQLWSYFIDGGAVSPSPAVANGVVYVGSTNFNFYAFGLK